MSLAVRKTQAALVYALAKENREERLRRAALDSQVHASRTMVPDSNNNYKNPSGTLDAVAAANASDLATSIVLAEALTGLCNRHAEDDGAHKVKYSSAPIATTAMTTEAHVVTRANAIKTWYVAHRTSTTYHPTADGSNAIAAADATDQTSINTLLNELKTDINAHVASGPDSFNFRPVDS